MLENILTQIFLLILITKTVQKRIQEKLGKFLEKDKREFPKSIIQWKLEIETKL